MKNLAYAPDPLNEQASVLVDAQTDIKLAIKKGVLSGASSLVIGDKIREIIDQALRKIDSSILRENARISLFRFAETAYERLRMVLPNPVTAIAVYTLIRALDGSKKETFIPKTLAEKSAVQVLYGGFYHTTAKGLPIRDFQPDMQRVKKALGELAMATVMDSDDLTGRNSLRNFAEMQVRYERHQEEIRTLRESGENLVICSVHGDCSDRCAPWQGRVYSLDGTTGTTKDGRKYVPLETATDIYYTTKAGRTYKNGLLGFNCRHKLTPYIEGMVVPTITEDERKRQDKITKTQRRMERDVIKARETALMYKDVNAKLYQQARNVAKARFEEYKNFSKENKRAYYPDRVKIL